MTAETLWHAAPIIAAAGLIVGALSGLALARHRGDVPNDPTIGQSPYYPCARCARPTAHTPGGRTCRNCGTQRTGGAA